MKGKKTSSKLIVDVITSKLSDPDLSLRDIEKQTGVNHQTVSDIIEDTMSEVLTGSDKVRSLFEINADIINI